MAKYIILKPINLKGQKHRIGETVDESAVDQRRAWALQRSGYLAEIVDGKSKKEPEKEWKKSKQERNNHEKLSV